MSRRTPVLAPGLALVALLGLATTSVPGSHPEGRPASRPEPAASLAPTSPTPAGVDGRAVGDAWPPVAAGPDDPVYTTYAAPLERSEYLVDEGWSLEFHDPSRPLAASSDSAGSWGVGFRVDGALVHSTGDYFRRPVVRRSFASLARLDFELLADVEVDATLAVHSSRQSFLDLEIANRSDRPWEIEVHAFLTAPASGLGPASRTAAGDGLLTAHEEPREAWSESPPPEYENAFHDVLLLDAPADAWGGYRAGEVAMLAELRRGLVSGDLDGRPEALLLVRKLRLDPGAAGGLRVVRAVAPLSEGTDGMLERARQLLGVPAAELEREAAARFAPAPDPTLAPDDELVYRSALALARQVMLPPEGRTAYNYYVFSREPTWSWGHDGQVFHESLTMLAYAWLDPASAMDSQRVFIEAQDATGYIPYRIGPYVVRTFPVEGRRTTSAPFFAWTSLEVYRTARQLLEQGRPGLEAQDVDGFLREAYEAGSRFVEFLLRERDVDGDGLLEWGGHAVLESVRDSLVPIWALLGDDDPTAPSRLEALDLSSMAVQEMASLAKMAEELGREEEAASWGGRAERLAALVDSTMWDPETGFYYNVDRDTNAFVTPQGLDLRRMEIIGFLPLWAGIAPRERAATLIRHLTDPARFWRRFGVPTLAADDPGYEPLVRRCCQWNGAVWLEWDYLVFDGLRRYGYPGVARQLGRRMVDAAATQLRRRHRFNESYSPDHSLVRSPDNYVWNGILARVLLDLAGEGT